MGAKAMLPSFSARQKKIIALIREIPAGQVASYGQIAELAGIPRGSRLVVRVLRDPGIALAWWRVLRSDGSCAVEGQLERLRGEGIIADKRVDLRRYRWQGLDYLLFAHLL